MTNSNDQNVFEDRRQSDALGEPASNEKPRRQVAALRPISRAIAPPASGFELSDKQAGASFQEMAEIIRRQRWKLAAFVVLPLIATGFVTTRLTHLFESTVSINVEARGNRIVGEQASTPSLSEMDQIMSTQVALIESDPVLRPAAEKYRLLDLEGQSRWMNQSESNRLRKARIVLKRLKVERVPNTSILRVSYRAPDPQLAADIVTMIASSFITHAFDSREESNSAVSTSVARQLGDLQTKIVASDAAIAEFAKQLGFVDPDQHINPLSARLLQLNSDYTAAQSERLHKEALFNATKSGSLAGAQVSNQGSLLDGAMIRLNAAKDEFARVSTIFGESHPDYIRVSRQMTEAQRQFDEARGNTTERAALEYHQTLEREQMAHDLLASTRVEVDGLTAKALEYQRLKSEGDSYRKLYDDLERITREQAINQSFQQAILQVVEPAHPSAKAVSPSMLLNLAAGFALSLVFGLGAVFVIDMLDGRVRTPADAARLPHVDVIAAMPRFGKHGGKIGKNQNVVATMPKSHRTRLLLEYQESIRGLRNSLISLAFDQPFRSLVVTSPADTRNGPNVISNLAFSYAILGRKVLLIDANLREPSLHAIFEKNGDTGLSDVLGGHKTWRETLVQSAREQLFFMPAGVMTEASSDLMSQGMSSLLEEAYAEFDLVLILAPPVLSAPETAVLAGLADGVLVMARAQFTSSSEITEAYTILQRSRANIIGMVVNDVKGLTKPKLYAASPSARIA